MIAKGRSKTMYEVDILHEALRNMIDSVEHQFRSITDTLKAEIYDIEHDPSYISMDYNDARAEMASRVYFFENALQETELQHFQALNKLYICIYSMCESSLGDICYNYGLLDRQNGNKKEHHKDRTSKLDVYLKTLGIDFNDEQLETDSFIINKLHRLIRNSLTHSSTTNKKAKHAVIELNRRGITGIECTDERIQILDNSFLSKFLDRCITLLKRSEQKAIEISPKIIKK